MKLETTSTYDLQKHSKNLKGFRIFSADEVKGKIPKTISAIVNLDDSSGGGTHWVAFYNAPNQKYTIYYDSFGMEPDPRVLKYLKTSGKQVVGLTGQQQDLASHACGYYCIYFLRQMNEGVSPSEFLSQWSSNEKKNEQLLQKIFNNNNKPTKGEGISFF